jgi:hypothetical protein
VAVNRRPAKPERILHVSRTCRGWEIDLRLCWPRALEKPCDRQSERLCEIVGLVEAAGSLASRMERDWNHAVCIPEHLRTGVTQHRCETRRDRSAAVVFQCVNDVAKPALIGPNRPRAIDRVWRLPARTADIATHDGCEHRRQRIAASVTDWRRDQVNARPAEIANGAVERMRERRAARGAWRLKEPGECEVGEIAASSPESQSWRRHPRVDRDCKSPGPDARRRGPRSRSSRGGSIRPARGLRHAPDAAAGA